MKQIFESQKDSKVIFNMTFTTPGTLKGYLIIHIQVFTINFFVSEEHPLLNVYMFCSLELTHHCLGFFMSLTLKTNNHMFIFKTPSTT